MACIPRDLHTCIKKQTDIHRHIIFIQFDTKRYVIKCKNSQIDVHTRPRVTIYSSCNINKYDIHIIERYIGMLRWSAGEPGDLEYIYNWNYTTAFIKYKSMSASPASLDLRRWLVDHQGSLRPDWTTSLYWLNGSTVCGETWQCVRDECIIIVHRCYAISRKKS